MEAEYVEATINNKLIRIDKNNSMNVYNWRDWVKNPYWYKIKVILSVNKNTGYKKYYININRKNYNLSRIVFKAHNNDWNITDISKNNFIDHININSLDNRIENLRILTNQQNQWNTNRNAKGYYWNKRKNKWNAQISINGKKKYLGYFDNEEDALIAYLNAKELYHKLPAI